MERRKKRAPLTPVTRNEGSSELKPQNKLSKERQRAEEREKRTQDDIPAGGIEHHEGIMTTKIIEVVEMEVFNEMKVKMIALLAVVLNARFHSSL